MIIVTKAIVLRYKLYTLNLHDVICQLYQLYVSKAGRKKEKIVSLNDTHNLQ